MSIQEIQSTLIERGWLHHIKTIASTVGILAYGVALGVKWAITDTANTIGLLEVAPVVPTLNEHMRWMLVLAVAGLALAAWIETRGEPE